FLFQFGITAAAAITVSLLVSFSLTPMMSARLLRGGHPSATSSHAVVVSRRGFYAWIERGYMWMLDFVIQHRVLVMCLAFGVIASALPLYTTVRQEYIPSDVDEAEFDVNVTAPERASLAAMDGVMQTVEAELHETPGVRLVLTFAGGGFLGNVNQGGAYVRI